MFVPNFHLDMRARAAFHFIFLGITLSPQKVSVIAVVVSRGRIKEERMMI